MISTNDFCSFSNVYLVTPIFWPFSSFLHGRSLYAYRQQNRYRLRAYLYVTVIVCGDGVRAVHVPFLFIYRFVLVIHDVVVDHRLLFVYRFGYIFDVAGDAPLVFSRPVDRVTVHRVRYARIYWPIVQRLSTRSVVHGPVNMVYLLRLTRVQ